VTAKALEAKATVAATTSRQVNVFFIKISSKTIFNFSVSTLPGHRGSLCVAHHLRISAFRLGESISTNPSEHHWTGQAIKPYAEGLVQRRTMKRTGLTLVVLVVLTALAGGAGTKDPETRIRGSLAAWVKAFNSGDLKAAASVWAPDLAGWAPEGLDDTYALEQEYAAKDSGKPPSVIYSLEIVEVMVSGDMAVVRDKWTESLRENPSKARTFRSFEVWRRQPDGSWKIARWIDGPIKEVR
jgi:steroid delta-isomerase